MVYRRLLGALFAAALLLAGTIMARAADPITIGFGMALTGGLAPNGKAALFAMQFWEKDDQCQGRAARPAGEAGLLR
jgi:branched-chain amino acid transport system substrate-binding protein